MKDLILDVLARRRSLVDALLHPNKPIAIKLYQVVVDGAVVGEISLPHLHRMQMDILFARKHLLTWLARVLLLPIVVVSALLAVLPAAVLVLPTFIVSLFASIATSFARLVVANGGAFTFSSLSIWPALVTLALYVFCFAVVGKFSLLGNFRAERNRQLLAHCQAGSMGKAGLRPYGLYVPSQQLFVPIN